MRIPSRLVATAIAATTSAGLAACGGEDTDPDDLPPAAAPRPAPPDASGVKNVAVRIGDAPELATLERAIAQADLLGPLQTRPSLTVFAPTDEAFAESPDLVAPGAPTALRRVLLDHVVPRRVPAARLTDGLELETLGGTVLRVRRTGDGVTVDGVPVGETDLAASNGVVHTVGAVLGPSASRP